MIDNNKIKKSKEAIIKYVDFNKINNLRHIAKVLISSNGKSKFNSQLFICISKEQMKVIIEYQTTGDYKPEYDIGNDNFSFINRTLIIETKDIWNNNISINITKI
ncbi:MAG: hypothetical protein E7180_05925 [Erysipelotrichaceae bacterium]|nr:hypothetical protein [Erysipelotrichaceae bacterium]